MNRVAMVILAASSAMFLAGCHLDMYIQPKVKSQSQSDFFADGSGTRLPVPGAVEYGKAKTDSEFYLGRNAAGKLVSEFPIEVNERVVNRGQDRFTIFCSHCHGAAGDGKGMIAQRGFTLAQPVGNYHSDRLRGMPVGHFFDVITNGHGTMYGQGSRIKPEDRWAIVSYIRTLQLSQSAPAQDLDAEAAAKLGTGPGSATGPLFKTGQAIPALPETEETR